MSCVRLPGDLWVRLHAAGRAQGMDADSLGAEAIAVYLGAETRTTAGVPLMRRPEVPCIVSPLPPSYPVPVQRLEVFLEGEYTHIAHRASSVPVGVCDSPAATRLAELAELFLWALAMEATCLVPKAA